MEQKYPQLPDNLYEYLVAHSGVLHDDLLNELRQRTLQLGSYSGMQVPRENGTLLTILAMGASNALEIGTFTGYSAICIARGLGPNGHLTCLDMSEEWTNIAREYWQKGGVADRIELRVGLALDTLRELLNESDQTFDFVFIDADKPNYDAYYELVLPRVRPNGLILFDNMLWQGRVLDANDADESTVAIRNLNTKIAADSRVISLLLPIGDGIHLCRKIS